ncbi:MAG: TonB-dependent receptor [Lentimicrobiaceae bacterium]|jgi:outer membrane receptor protein involved in Fe transport|nr:TonB-dependent receptor [Lentimicrobiaceae bacterium]
MKQLSILIFCLLPFFSFSQTVKGFVYDAQTHEALTGVNIYYSDDNENMIGTTSDEEGFYTLRLPVGSIRVTFSFLGFETRVIPLVATRDKTITQNVELYAQQNIMQEVVVSAGRYEQKLSEITVSMEVLKAKEIIAQNPTDLSGLLKNISGVDITDKQPSIRGGSGWTYGVGSRSLILVDGMSVLSPGGNEINWNIIPLENVEQIEVLKGASSVLYGSSALNGLINVRTSRPSLEPKTRINTYMGVYGNPKNEDYAWWGHGFYSKNNNRQVDALLRNEIFFGIKNPMYNGFDFSHSRRIANIDVSGGINIYSNEGYRQGNYDKRLRIGGNLTYHDEKVKGLNYGLNVNFLTNQYGGFFIQRSANEPYLQSPLTNMGREGTSFYIDPFMNFINTKKNTTHRLKGRVFIRTEKIISNTTDRTLADIAANMKVNYEELPELFRQIQNYETEMLPEMLPFVLSGDVNGLVNYIKGYGETYFPGATATDYVDLISWIMGHTPFPADVNDIVPWLTTEPEKPNLPPDKNSSYYVDYQFNKKFENAAFTTGATFEHVTSDSEITGYHESDNIGAYLQYDHKFFEKLNASAGVRFEYYRVDELYREAETKIFGTKFPFKPVIRAGLNYELAEYSNIRASFGQGYRYPSITEKFVYKDIGGIAAYPNPELKPEMGYNAEIGFKQGYKLGTFMGFIDIAGFYTQYKNMIEFQFGLFNNTTYEYVDNLGNVISMITEGQTPGLGTRFQNVDRAQIYGIDISVNGFMNITPEFKLNYSLGYVYIEPIDLDYKKRNNKEESNSDPLAIKNKSNTSKYLKYRQKNTLKGIFDLQWRRWNIATNMTWKSKTLAVDYFIVDERDKLAPDMMDPIRDLIFSGLHDYWKDNNKGYFTMDVRFGVKATERLQFQFHINNILNSEYSVRPMDVSAPRTFVFQIVANL